MKWGFLHQGKDFSVSTLDPRRKGRFDSVCTAGITAQLPISLLAPSRVPAWAARLWVWPVLHIFFTLTSPPYPLERTTLVHAGRWAIPGAHQGAVSPSSCLQHSPQHDRVTTQSWGGTPLPWNSLKWIRSTLSMKYCPLALPEPTAKSSSCCWRNLVALFHPALWAHQSLGAARAAVGRSPGAQERVPGSVSTLQVKNG